MHRSRIGVVLIDHAEGHDEALAFWAGATGALADTDEEYTSLGRLGSLNLEVQRTGPGTPPRVHLDIETDDVPAEVARVVALGARVVEERSDYTILEDPGGLVFCVVPVQTGDRFEAEAVTWE
jgi:hypothetical protein